MRALTIWQPWAHAILHLEKRIENRPWACPKHLRRKLFAIHAGKRFDAESFGDLAGELGTLPPREEIPLGAVVGVAMVDRVVIASSSLLDPEQVRWWAGPYGWELSHVRALPAPIPCRGFQGFWPLPDDVRSQVRDELQRPTG